MRGRKIFTWMGLAAVNKPAIPPPITRPSGPASETLNPPVLLLTPPESETVNDPDNDNISNRPCKIEVKNFIAYPNTLRRKRLCENINN